VNALKLDEVFMPSWDQILQAAAQHAARSIRVFGSVDRRQDDADSDIDFLVEMEPGLSLFGFDGKLLRPNCSH